MIRKERPIIMQNNRYEISVVTPCHNPDMELLKRCYESLKNQTIGFENIEWILVSHNNSDEQFEEMTRLVDGHENVKLFKLNNTVYSPSSPRNYGLDYVKGKYIGFLDADDVYETDVVAKTTESMTKNDAQVAMFRMECISADPARLAIKQFVFFDQTQQEIVLEKGKWDSSKMIYGAALNVTSKMYSASYISSLKLRFDEEIIIAEDNNFNCTAFARADRIVILPQLIGYRYWMHDGSLMQTFDKKPEEVKRIAKGMKKLIDNGTSEGLYMNYVMCDVLGLVSALMLASKDMTLDDRMEIHDMLGQYLDRLEPVSPSKLYAKQTASMLNTLPKFAIGKPKTIDRICKIMRVLHVDIGKQIASRA